MSLVFEAPGVLASVEVVKAFLQLCIRPRVLKIHGLEEGLFRSHSIWDNAFPEIPDSWQR